MDDVLVTEENRTWTRENVHKETTSAVHGGGRLSREVKSNPNYSVLRAWENRINKYFSRAMELTDNEYSENTWLKWRLRFLRNNDNTNRLFLECLKRMAGGNILYSTLPDVVFVSKRQILLVYHAFGHTYPNCCFQTFVLFVSGRAPLPPWNIKLEFDERLLARGPSSHFRNGAQKRDRMEGCLFESVHQSQASCSSCPSLRLDQGRKQNVRECSNPHSMPAGHNCKYLNIFFCYIVAPVWKCTLLWYHRKWLGRIRSSRQTALSPMRQSPLPVTLVCGGKQ